jgi:hypothetical protein
MIIDEEIKSIIKADCNSWNLCFDIKLKHAFYHRTDSNSEINAGGKRFLPANGLQLKSKTTEENGKFSAILSGYYSSDFNFGLNLIGAEITCYIYIKTIQRLCIWFSLACTNIIEDEDKFELHLLSERRKYENQLLKIYSKTCRAKLGDSKCGVDLSRFPSETCDKTFLMCCNKFNNAINFRGEPFIPTQGYFKYDEIK